MLGCLDAGLSNGPKIGRRSHRSNATPPGRRERNRAERRIEPRVSRKRVARLLRRRRMATKDSDLERSITAWGEAPRSGHRTLRRTRTRGCGSSRRGRTRGAPGSPRTSDPDLVRCVHLCTTQSRSRNHPVQFVGRAHTRFAGRDRKGYRRSDRMANDGPTTDRSRNAFQTSDERVLSVSWDRSRSKSRPPTDAGLEESQIWIARCPRC